MSGPLVGLVHAGAEGVYEESARAEELIRSVGAEPCFIAVNEAGIQLPTLHHWGSLHPNKLPLWMQWRADRGLEPCSSLWALSPTHAVPNAVRTWSGGSSGLHGIDIALNGLGLACAIGCGMPLDDRKNQFTGKPWGAHQPFKQGWTDAAVMRVIRDRVRVMCTPHPLSGVPAFTTHLLGMPDEEWLRSALHLV